LEVKETNLVAQALTSVSQNDWILLANSKEPEISLGVEPLQNPTVL
jgi:hypothetical protein